MQQSQKLPQKVGKFRAIPTDRSGQELGSVNQQPQKAAQRLNEYKGVSTSQISQSVKNSSKQSLQSSEEVLEIEELVQRVKSATIPEVLREKTMKMIGRLHRMAKFGSYSGEYELIEKYIDWVVRIPWNSWSKDNLDLKNAKAILDANHFGLKSVKERVLEYLAIAQLSPAVQKTSVDELGSIDKQRERQHAPILCFVGIQGIGKTSMARSIAHALGRKFLRISLGAMGSVTDLKGQSRAFLDAEPGQIMKALVRTGVINPLILLDEVDKVSEAEGRRADINAALLEILDPEQNSSFSDSYIDYPVDLSRVLFITTANTLSTLTTALLDRLEIIRFPSYSDEEKEEIGKNYILPKVLKACGLGKKQVEITQSTWPLIIRPLGFDAGVRQLERNITAICRKIARKIVEGKGDHFVISPENFREYLPADIGVYS